MMCLARDNLSEGSELEMYPTMPASIHPFATDFYNFSDCDEWEESLEELNRSEYEND